MATAIYLAHLNPLTNAHADIIKELEKKDEVVVMPVPVSYTHLTLPTILLV